MTNDMTVHDKLIVALGEILQERRNKLGLSKMNWRGAVNFIDLTLAMSKEAIGISR